MLQYILHERRIWRHFGGKPSHELTDAATKRIPETELPANTPPFRTPWKSQFNPNGNRSSGRRLSDMETDLAHGSDITHQIIGLAMRVHRRLGPGLLESVYEACLCHELRRSETPFERQVRLPVRYDDARLDCGYVADIIVCRAVLLELKSVERLLPLHEAQLLTYLRLTTCRIGLLINFNTVSLTDGIKRCVL